MLNLVLFGPPGSGKGTQSAKLIEKYQLVHLSTGDILRAELKAQTALAAEAKKYMDQGELVPDSIIFDMVAAKLDQNKSAKGFIFDGFPRNAKQADVLDKMLADKGTAISCMVALDVEKDELVRRLLNRGVEQARVDDQDISIIENRIVVYNKETLPLIDYYKAQNKFYNVLGIGSVDDIFGRISEVIDNL